MTMVSNDCNHEGSSASLSSPFRCNSSTNSSCCDQSCIIYSTTANIQKPDINNYNNIVVRCLNSNVASETACTTGSTPSNDSCSSSSINISYTTSTSTTSNFSTPYAYRHKTRQQKQQDRLRFVRRSRKQQQQQQHRLIVSTVAIAFVLILRLTTIPVAPVVLSFLHSTQRISKNVASSQTSSSSDSNNDSIIKYKTITDLMLMRKCTNPKEYNSNNHKWNLHASSTSSSSLSFMNGSSDELSNGIDSTTAAAAAAAAPARTVDSTPLSTSSRRNARDFSSGTSTGNTNTVATTNLYNSDWISIPENIDFDDNVISASTTTRTTIPTTPDIEKNMSNNDDINSDNNSTSTTKLLSLEEITDLLVQQQQQIHQLQQHILEQQQIQEQEEVENRNDRFMLSSTTSTVQTPKIQPSAEQFSELCRNGQSYLNPGSTASSTITMIDPLVVDNKFVTESRQVEKKYNNTNNNNDDDDDDDDNKKKKNNDDDNNDDTANNVISVDMKVNNVLQEIVEANQCRSRTSTSAVTNTGNVTNTVIPSMLNDEATTNATATSVFNEIDIATAVLDAIAIAEKAIENAEVAVAAASEASTKLLPLERIQQQGEMHVELPSPSLLLSSTLLSESSSYYDRSSNTNIRQQQQVPLQNKQQRLQSGEKEYQPNQLSTPILQDIEDKLTMSSIATTITELTGRIYKASLQLTSSVLDTVTAVTTTAAAVSNNDTITSNLAWTDKSSVDKTNFTVPDFVVQGSVLNAIILLAYLNQNNVIVSHDIGESIRLLVTVPIIASYLTFTQGTIGQTLRTLGGLTWNITESIAQFSNENIVPVAGSVLSSVMNLVPNITDSLSTVSTNMINVTETQSNDLFNNIQKQQPIISARSLDDVLLADSVSKSQMLEINVETMLSNAEILPKISVLNLNDFSNNDDDDSNTKVLSSLQDTSIPSFYFASFQTITKDIKAEKTTATIQEVEVLNVETSTIAAAPAATSMTIAKEDSASMVSTKESETNEALVESNQLIMNEPVMENEILIATPLSIEESTINVESRVKETESKNDDMLVIEEDVRRLENLYDNLDKIQVDLSIEEIVALPEITFEPTTDVDTLTLKKLEINADPVLDAPTVEEKGDEKQGSNPGTFFADLIVQEVGIETAKTNVGEDVVDNNFPTASTVTSASENLLDLIRRLRGASDFVSPPIVSDLNDSESNTNTTIQQIDQIETSTVPSSKTKTVAPWDQYQQSMSYVSTPLQNMLNQLRTSGTALIGSMRDALNIENAPTVVVGKVNSTDLQILENVSIAVEESTLPASVIDDVSQVIDLIPAISNDIEAATNVQLDTSKAFETDKAQGEMDVARLRSLGEELLAILINQDTIQDEVSSEVDLNIVMEEVVAAVEDAQTSELDQSIGSDMTTNEKNDDAWYESVNQILDIHNAMISDLSKEEPMQSTNYELSEVDDTLAEITTPGRIAEALGTAEKIPNENDTFKTDTRHEIQSVVEVNVTDDSVNASEISEINIVNVDEWLISKDEASEDIVRMYDALGQLSSTEALEIEGQKIMDDEEYMIEDNDGSLELNKIPPAHMMDHTSLQSTDVVEIKDSVIVIESSEVEVKDDGVSSLDTTEIDLPEYTKESSLPTQDTAMDFSNVGPKDGTQATLDAIEVDLMEYTKESLQPIPEFFTAIESGDVAVKDDTQSTLDTHELDSREHTEQSLQPRRDLVTLIDWLRKDVTTKPPKRVVDQTRSTHYRQSDAPPRIETAISLDSRKGVSISATKAIKPKILMAPTTSLYRLVNALRSGLYPPIPDTGHTADAEATTVSKSLTFTDNILVPESLDVDQADYDERVSISPGIDTLCPGSASLLMDDTSLLTSDGRNVSDAFDGITLGLMHTSNQFDIDNPYPETSGSIPLSIDEPVAKGKDLRELITQLRTSTISYGDNPKVTVFTGEQPVETLQQHMVKRKDSEHVVHSTLPKLVSAVTPLRNLIYNLRIQPDSHEYQTELTAVKVGVVTPVPAHIEMLEYTDRIETYPANEISTTEPIELLVGQHEAIADNAVTDDAMRSLPTMTTNVHEIRTESFADIDVLHLKKQDERMVKETSKMDFDVVVPTETNRLGNLIDRLRKDVVADDVSRSNSNILVDMEVRKEGKVVTIENGISSETKPSMISRSFGGTLGTLISLLRNTTETVVNEYVTNELLHHPETGVTRDANDHHLNARMPQDSNSVGSDDRIYGRNATTISASSVITSGPVSVNYLNSLLSNDQSITTSTTPSNGVAIDRDDSFEYSNYVMEVNEAERLSSDMNQDPEVTVLPSDLKEFASGSVDNYSNGISAVDISSSAIDDEALDAAVVKAMETVDVLTTRMQRLLERLQLEQGIE